MTITKPGSPWDNTVRAALRGMQDEVHANNVRAGWAGDGAPARSFGDDIALLHSEVSEAFEAYRDHGLEDFTQPSLSPDALPKPEGVGSEFADILIRLLDSCERNGIDLAFEYQRKIAYNATRAHRHGGKRI